MKLWEGNVYTRVYLFRGSPCDHYHDALDLTIQAPTSLGPALPARDIWWPSLETCSNLFTPIGTGIW